MGIEGLNRIFNPKRVAVIGASDREGSIGAKILQNLVGVGYKGAVCPVNAFRQSVQGISAYPSITKIPEKVDLAIIATPAHTVPQIVEECGKAGVAGVIISSAGFRESGKDGIMLEEEILQHQKTYGIRIIGPNSIGIIRPKINLFATFAHKQAKPGRIAFISQSASLAASALDWALEAQIGFSAVVSTGSMLDVGLADLIDFFGKDAQTQSLVLYVESLKNVRRFISAAREFALTKPIFVVKAGRFAEVLAQAKSRSKTLAGEDAIYEAAFRRAGVVRVETMRDMFDCAEALALQNSPSGANLTIVTNAGGPALLATDLLIARGGKLAILSEDTFKALCRVLPSYCSYANPIDVLEEADPKRFKAVLNACINDSVSDSFLLIYARQANADPVVVAKAAVDASKKTIKPLLVCLIGEDNRCRKARRFLHQHGVPAFATPEQAVSTFMHMVKFTQNRELLYQTPEDFNVEPENPGVLRDKLKNIGSEWRSELTLPESFHFLETYGIPTVITLTAATQEDAVAAVSRLGCPVVMKALSPQITHKSEVQGVILNVISPSHVPYIFSELGKRVKKIGNAEFQGVVVQPMVLERRHELFLAAKKDPQFGPIILFGMGGTKMELFRDVSIGFPPLNRVLARRLVESTAIYKHAIDTGHPLNMTLLEEVLVRFSRMIQDFPEIKEVEINPLILNEEEAIAVDARMLIGEQHVRCGTSEPENFAIAPYPREYVSDCKLKNGVSVMLRPIIPEDEDRFNGFLRSLSEETMRFRFFAIFKEMSHDALVKYCNLDYDREVAIIAEPKGRFRHLIGAVRLAIEPEGKDGEFGIVISDESQGLGLGSKFMDLLIKIAKDKKLIQIHGYVLANNYKMLTLCYKKGFKSAMLDEYTVEVILPLVDKPQQSLD